MGWTNNAKSLERLTPFCILKMIIKAMKWEGSVSFAPCIEQLLLISRPFQLERALLTKKRKMWKSENKNETLNFFKCALVCIKQHVVFLFSMIWRLFIYFQSHNMNLKQLLQLSGLKWHFFVVFVVFTVLDTIACITFAGIQQKWNYEHKLFLKT